MIFDMTLKEKRKMKSDQATQKTKEKEGKWIKCPAQYKIGSVVVKEPIKTLIFVPVRKSKEYCIEKYFKNRRRYGNK